MPDTNAMLFCFDIKDSTSIVNRLDSTQQEIFYKTITTTVDAILNSIKNDHGCDIKKVQYTGDGYYLLCEKPESCLLLFRYLNDGFKNNVSYPVEIRCGACFGKLNYSTENDGCISGSLVNLTARVCSCAQVGELMINATLYDLIYQNIMNKLIGIYIHDEKTFNLKGIGETFLRRVSVVSEDGIFDCNTISTVSPERYNVYALEILKQINKANRIDEVFTEVIPLQLYPIRFMVKGKSKKDDTYSFIDIINRLSEQEHVSFLASSGSGKTVTLRQVCEKLAIALKDFDGESKILPVWVDLRDYRKRDKSQQDGYIIKTSKSFINRHDLSFDAAARYGYTICYLLDGYNEVPFDCHDECAEEISSLTSNYVIVTSRPFGIALQGLVPYGIMPLSDDAIPEIAERFFDNKSKLESFKNEFMGLPESIKETLSKPLFLKMALIICRETDGIPMMISQLIGTFFEWLCKRDKDRGIYYNIPFEQQEIVLCRIAFHMQKHGRLTATKQEVLDIVAEVCTKGGYTRNGESVLNALCYHGVLENDEFRVKFYHQSFQEYFAAKELSYRLHDEPEIYESYLTRPGWEGIVMCMPGIYQDIERLIRQLICDQYEKQFELAIDIAYQLNFSDDVRSVIDEEIQAMFACQNDDDKDDYQRTAVDALERIWDKIKNFSTDEQRIIFKAADMDMSRGTKDRLTALLANTINPYGTAGGVRS